MNWTHRERLMKNWRTCFPEDAIVPSLRHENDSIVLLIGGIDPAKPYDYDLGVTIFVYHPRIAKWFFGGYLPEPRNYHAAGLCYGMVYITGGCSQFHIDRGVMIPTRTVFQLNPLSRRVHRCADMHHCRAHHGLCVINVSVIVVGGINEHGQLLSSVEAYHTQNDQWTMVVPLPVPMMGLCATLLNKDVIVMGGLVKDEHSNSYSVTEKVYMSCPTRGWREISPLPEPVAFCSAVTTRREIWVWCGVGNNLSDDGTLCSRNEVFVFSCSENRWTTQMRIPKPKHSMAIAVTKSMDRNIFLIGGMTSTTKEALSENDIYNRDTGQLYDGVSLPKAIVGSAAICLPPYKPRPTFKYLPGAERSALDLLELATIKIQAAYRGYLLRSRLRRDPAMPRAASAAAAASLRQSRHLHEQQNAPVRENVIVEEFRRFTANTLKAWPPTPNPTSSKSCINLTLGSQYPGYTVTRDNFSSIVKRYICLSPDIDPNIGMIPFLDDLYKKTRIAVGLKHIDQTPFYSVELRNIESLRDDSVPVVLIIGGLCARDPLNLSLGKAVLKYHPLKDRFYYHGLIPEARNHHAAVYLDEKVYLTGGCDPEVRNSGEMVATRSTFCLNFESGEWVRRAPMLCSRAFHSLVVFDSQLYALGGRDSDGRLLRSIERYDPVTDQWSFCDTSMPKEVMGLSCTVFEQRIWLMGGIAAEDRNMGPNIEFDVLREVWTYSPITGNWIKHPPLRCPRAFGGAVVIGERIYLCGGCCRIPGQKSLISMASVDCYDPGDAEWTRATIIANPRHCACVVAVGDCIYVFGGMCSQEWSDLDRNEMVVTYDKGVHNLRKLPTSTTGAAAITIPPLRRSLRARSLACLVHTKLNS